MHLRTNSVAITGRLTRDPTLSTGGGDESAWELRVAVDCGPRDREIVRERLHYLDVTVRGRTGERAARQLDEGSEVAIHGHLEAREAPGEVATTRPAVRIVADRVECLGTPDPASRRSPPPGSANVISPGEAETLTTFTRLADVPFDG
ncbi:MAG TPA: single-stranded DNA-binding protein [Solirubrobacteraceae bacterium]|nr:single-stranded DNA-binding protein [Solirubrobacteraceae bacterium]